MSLFGFENNSEIKQWSEDVNDELKRKSDEAKKKVKKLEISNDVIKLNDTELPGCVDSISVDGELMFDESEIAGQSGKTKQIKGFSDATIQVNIRLFNKYDNSEYESLEGNKLYSGQSFGTKKILLSKYDMLEKIDKTFKQVKDGDPVVYSIVNKHLNARNVKSIYFNKLSSTETIDGINCSLDFTETDPAVNNKQKQDEKKKELEPDKKKEDNYRDKAVKDMNKKEDKKVTDYQKKKDAANKKLYFWRP